MFLRRIICVLITFSFLATSVIPPQRAYAQTLLNLPEPGTMVSLSSAYTPLLIKGLKINPKNPLNLDFIVATGNSQLTDKDPQFQIESKKLIKYFFAALTLPEKDVWVNLSPYEKDRIVPQVTGQTEMGRDMLAQDYLLKQMTASLIYPEKGLGRDFWNKVYSQAFQRFGTTQIPVNTFNKVWIVADRATVYENKDTVIVVDSHLKVMLDEDYLAMQKHKNSVSFPNASVGNLNTTHTLGSQLIRQIVLPALEKEVNEGKNFAPLRQIFHSLILAKWYKETLKTALLNQVYSDRNKIAGLSYRNSNAMPSPNALVGDPQYIYQQYLKAYKKGVFNYIKEDIDETSKQPMPRKYFSGGVTAAMKIITVNSVTLAISTLLAAGALGAIYLVHTFEKSSSDKNFPAIQQHSLTNSSSFSLATNNTAMTSFIIPQYKSWFMAPIDKKFFDGISSSLRSFRWPGDVRIDFNRALDVPFRVWWDKENFYIVCDPIRTLRNLDAFMAEIDNKINFKPQYAVLKGILQGPGRPMLQVALGQLVREANGVTFPEFEEQLRNFERARVSIMGKDKTSQIEGKIKERTREGTNKIIFKLREIKASKNTDRIRTYIELSADDRVIACVALRIPIDETSTLLRGFGQEYFMGDSNPLVVAMNGLQKGPEQRWNDSIGRLMVEELIQRKFLEDIDRLSKTWVDPVAAAMKVSRLKDHGILLFRNSIKFDRPPAGRVITFTVVNLSDRREVKITINPSTKKIYIKPEIPSSAYTIDFEEYKEFGLIGGLVLYANDENVIVTNVSSRAKEIDSVNQFRFINHAMINETPAIDPIRDRNVIAHMNNLIAGEYPGEFALRALIEDSLWDRRNQWDILQDIVKVTDGRIDLRKAQFLLDAAYLTAIFNLGLEDFRILRENLVPVPGHLRNRYRFKTAEMPNTEGYFDEIAVKLWKQRWERIIPKDVLRDVFNQAMLSNGIVAHIDEDVLKDVQSQMQALPEKRMPGTENDTPVVKITFPGKELWRMTAQYIPKDRGTVFSLTIPLNSPQGPFTAFLEGDKTKIDEKLIEAVLVKMGVKVDTDDSHLVSDLLLKYGQNKTSLMAAQSYEGSSGERYKSYFKFYLPSSMAPALEAKLKGVAFSRTSGEVSGRAVIWFTFVVRDLKLEQKRLLCSVLNAFTSKPAEIIYNSSSEDEPVTREQARLMMADSILDQQFRSYEFVTMFPQFETMLQMGNRNYYVKAENGSLVIYQLNAHGQRKDLVRLSGQFSLKDLLEKCREARIKLAGIRIPENIFLFVAFLVSARPEDLKTVDFFNLNWGIKNDRDRFLAKFDEVFAINTRAAQAQAFNDKLTIRVVKEGGLSRVTFSLKGSNETVSTTLSRPADESAYKTINLVDEYLKVLTGDSEKAWIDWCIKNNVSVDSELNLRNMARQRPIDDVKGSYTDLPTILSPLSNNAMTAEKEFSEQLTIHVEKVGEKTREIIFAHKELNRLEWARIVISRPEGESVEETANLIVEYLNVWTKAGRSEWIKWLGDHGFSLESLPGVFDDFTDPAPVDDLRGDYYNLPMLVSVLSKKMNTAMAAVPVSLDHGKIDSYVAQLDLDSTRAKEIIGGYLKGRIAPLEALRGIKFLFTNGDDAYETHAARSLLDAIWLGVKFDLTKEEIDFIRGNILDLKGKFHLVLKNVVNYDDAEWKEQRVIETAQVLSQRWDLLFDQERIQGQEVMPGGQLMASNDERLKGIDRELKLINFRLAPLPSKSEVLQGVEFLSARRDYPGFASDFADQLQVAPYQSPKVKDFLANGGDINELIKELKFTERFYKEAGGSSEDLKKAYILLIRYFAFKVQKIDNSSGEYHQFFQNSLRMAHFVTDFVKQLKSQNPQSAEHYINSIDFLRGLSEDEYKFLDRDELNNVLNWVTDALNGYVYPLDDSLAVPQGRELKNIPEDMALYIKGMVPYRFLRSTDNDNIKNSWYRNAWSFSWAWLSARFQIRTPDINAYEYVARLDEVDLTDATTGQRFPRRVKEIIKYDAKALAAQWELIEKVVLNLKRMDVLERGTRSDAERRELTQLMQENSSLRAKIQFLGKYLYTSAAMTSVMRDNYGSMIKEIAAEITAPGSEWRPKNYPPGVDAHLDSHRAQIRELQAKGKLSAFEAEYATLFAESHDLGYSIKLNDDETLDKLQAIWTEIGRIVGYDEETRKRVALGIREKLASYNDIDHLIALKMDELSQNNTTLSPNALREQASDMVLNERYLVTRILAHGTTGILLMKERLQARGLDEEKAFGMALIFAAHHVGYPISMVKDFVPKGTFQPEWLPVLLITGKEALDAANKDNPEAQTQIEEKLRHTITDEGSKLLGIPLLEGRYYATLGYALDRITPARMMTTFQMGDFVLNKNGAYKGEILWGGPGETVKKYPLIVTNIKDPQYFTVKEVFRLTIENLRREARAAYRAWELMGQGLDIEPNDPDVARLGQLIMEESDAQIKKTEEMHQNILGMIKERLPNFSGNLKDIDSLIRQAIELNPVIKKTDKEKPWIEYLLGFLITIKTAPKAEKHIKIVTSKAKVATHEYDVIAQNLGQFISNADVVADLKSAPGVEIKEFKQGEVIIQQGDESDQNMYLILEGEVNIIQDGKIIATRYPGEVVGEMAALLGNPRVASVIAATSSVRVINIPASQGKKIVRTDSVKLMEIALGRLKSPRVDTAPNVRFHAQRKHDGDPFVTPETEINPYLAKINTVPLLGKINAIGPNIVKIEIVDGIVPLDVVKDRNGMKVLRISSMLLDVDNPEDIVPMFDLMASVYAQEADPRQTASSQAINFLKAYLKFLNNHLLEKPTDTTFSSLNDHLFQVIRHYGDVQEWKVTKALETMQKFNGNLADNIYDGEELQRQMNTLARSLYLLFNNFRDFPIDAYSQLREDMSVFRESAEENGGLITELRNRCAAMKVDPEAQMIQLKSLVPGEEGAGLMMLNTELQRIRTSEGYIFDPRSIRSDDLKRIFSVKNTQFQKKESWSWDELNDYLEKQMKKSEYLNREIQSVKAGTNWSSLQVFVDLMSGSDATFQMFITRSSVSRDIGGDENEWLAFMREMLIRVGATDRAMDTIGRLQAGPGGIDFNASRIRMTRQGLGMDVGFDPAMVARFRQGNFAGIDPVITGVTRITNYYPLLGLKTPEGDKQLAA